MSRMPSLSALALITTCVLVSGPVAGDQPASEIVPPVIALPGGAQTIPVWREDERARAIAVRGLHRSEFASTHLIRLRGAERPHHHDRHDLAITVLSGHSVLHFAERDVVLRAGDSAFIPRGSFHWAESRHPEASVVFAVFSPPFDGKDRRLAERPAEVPAR